ncbi:MAG: zf-HC2 domain-containing protein [Anaerolineales bacterium]|nr:zf-HC2 domain-containing protein [Anaerolineales bacterium]
MNCEELIRYLSDYIDRDLSDELLADAQAHLSTCRSCHVVLDTTRQTIYLYKQTGRRGIPVEHRADLFARLQRSLADRKDCSS